MTQIQRALRRFYLVMFVVLCLLLVQFWPYIEAPEPSVLLFTALSSLAYAAIFLSPVMLTGWVLEMLVRPRGEAIPRWKLALVYGPVYLLGLIVVLLVFIDLQLFKLYEYHINAFVWNLVTTPGGLAALGASQETISTVVVLVAVAALVLAVLLLLLHRVAAKSPAEPGRPVPRMAASLAVLLFLTLLVTEGVYAFSAYTDRKSVV